jgi:hypothetical protein
MSDEILMLPSFICSDLRDIQARERMITCGLEPVSPSAAETFNKLAGPGTHRRDVRMHVPHTGASLKLIIYLHYKGPHFGR